MTKTALVTGGSRGIGHVTAEMLGEREWNVMAPPRELLDFVDERRVNLWIRDWMQAGRPRIHALVFCHGEWYSKPVREQHDMDWYRQFSMRVVNPMRIMEFLLLEEPNNVPEVVVMVASTRGLIGGVHTGPYSLACASQIAMMQGYAREWGGTTRFNVVCPGLTDTDMANDVRATGGAKPDAFAQPAEAVAKVIVDLIEGDANGRVLRVVDGNVSEATWNW